MYIPFWLIVVVCAILSVPVVFILLLILYASLMYLWKRGYRFDDWFRG